MSAPLPKCRTDEKMGAETHEKATSTKAVEFWSPLPFSGTGTGDADAVDATARRAKRKVEDRYIFRSGVVGGWTVGLWDVGYIYR